MKSCKVNFLVGNGDKIEIINSSSIVYSCGDKDIVLKDVLVAPKIAKNLVSISQLTTDNDIVVEFHSHGCFVKLCQPGQFCSKRESRGDYMKYNHRHQQEGNWKI